MNSAMIICDLSVWLCCQSLYSSFISSRQKLALHHSMFLPSWTSDNRLKRFEEDALVDSFLDASKLGGEKFINIALAAAKKPLHILLEEKFISLLQSCKNTCHIRQIQAQVIVHGLQHSYYVVPKLIAQSAVLKQSKYARCLFDQVLNPDIVIYNVMFKGYRQNEEHKEALSLFRKMMETHIKPSCYTFPMILNSCGKVSALCLGEQVHTLAIKNGFKQNPFVSNTLIELYSGSGKVELAYKVFEELPLKNVVTWTSVINGFIACGNMESARELFDVAEEKDTVLWMSMISGYIKIGDMATAQMYFDKLPSKDVMSWNTMLLGYSNNGYIEACKNIFEAMPKRNVFTWNALINAYAKHGHFIEVLTTFNRMLFEKEVLPNDATLVPVISACARLGALDLGMWLHVYSQRVGYKGNIFVENSLMDMYAKCGQIDHAIKMFKLLVKRDLVSWNTIISGLAMHGHASVALAFFDEMKCSRVKPDGVTFVGVLSACSHIGSVDEGLSHFHSMADYSITPQIEHYGCLIDLYARSGRLAEALNFVNMMPMKADTVIWTCLLGASRIYKNAEIAELALKQLNALDPGNPSNYLALSNIYGDAEKWETVSKLKLAMRDNAKFRKIPGCSMIEILDKVVEFYSLDQRHPETEQIYVCLQGLSKLCQSVGFRSVDEELELGSYSIVEHKFN